MDDWEIQLLDEHLRHWYTSQDLARLWESETPARAIAAKLATMDLAFFLRYYLPEFFRDPPAECHWHVFADLQWAATNGRSNKLAESLPRGFGKSTIIAVGFPIWCIIGPDDPSIQGKHRTPLKHYIIIIKDSFEQSKLELQSIRLELEANEKLRADFGDLVGSPWGKTEITTLNGTKIDALGTGQKVRGRRHGPYRPDLIVADDLENDETVQSPTQRAKVKSWWARAVEKAGDPKTCDYIALATLIHYDCFQAWMIERPGVRARKYRALLEPPANQDLWDEWEEQYLNLDDPDRERTAELFYHENQPSMVHGSRVSWPERFPYIILRQMMLGEAQEVHGKRINAFSSEMQNEPISDEDRLFKSIHYWHWEHLHGLPHLVPDAAGEPIALRNCRLYGAIDPSLGETATGDFAALVEILLAPNGRMFVPFARIERMHPDRIINAVVERIQHWLKLHMAYSSFVIESNQFQKLFSSKTGLDLLARGYRLPISEVFSTHNKTARIDSLQPDLRNAFLLLYKEQSRQVPEDLHRLWEQLVTYPMGAYVDGLDALEMCRTEAASKGSAGHIDLTDLMIQNTLSGAMTSEHSIMAADPFG